MSSSNASRKSHTSRLLGCSAAAAFAAAIFAGAQAHAASYTWTTAVNGSFQDSSKWTSSGGTYPGTGDVAYFNNGGSGAYTVTLGNNVSSAQIQKGSGSNTTLDLGGYTYSLSNGTSMYIMSNSAGSVSLAAKHGTLTGTAMYVGSTTTGAGQLTLDGSSPIISTMTGQSVAGYTNGTGTINVSNGASATFGQVIVAEGMSGTHATGAFNVTGGSKVTVDGVGGNGFLWISYYSGDHGSVSITGTGSSINVTADNASGSVRIGNNDTGSLTIAQGGNLSTVGDVYLRLGTLNLNGSTITTDGTKGLYSTTTTNLNVTGLSNTVAGNVGLNGSSITNMVLSSTSDYSRLTQSGSGKSLTLAGKLNVTLGNSFQPVAGDTFDLFDWTSESGAFTTVNLPTLNAGLQWNQSGLYSNGTIKVESVPEPATLGLLGIGAIGLLSRRKRKQ